MSKDFILKAFAVEVRGYPPHTFYARSAGSALADAWRCDAFNAYTFKEFLKIARARRSQDMCANFGDLITVGGKAAFFVTSNSQYVQFVRPGSDVVLNSHPLDVEPEEYRPSTYREKAA